VSTQFERLAIGLIAWTLSDVIALSMALARHAAPHAPLTVASILVGLPMSIGFGIFGLVMFWASFKK
jgi:hypothetical protein